MNNDKNTPKPSRASFQILEATPEDRHAIGDALVAFNDSKVPIAMTPAYIPVSRVVKSPEGDLLGGIIGAMYGWNIMYIDILFVTEVARGTGLGAMLLADAERIAKDHQCHMIHLDTFDFQARGFYEKQGYEVFGVLEDCPKDHKRFYMKKLL